MIKLADMETFSANFSAWGDIERNVTVEVDADHPLRERFQLDEWVRTAAVYPEQYDTSPPGTYILFFMGGGKIHEPTKVPSNIVMFTRLP